jgi:WXG100 family type VII secretion target
MANEIQIQYDQLRQIARQCDARGDELKRVFESLKSQVEELRQKGWKSPTASTFYQEMDEDILKGMERAHLAMAAAQTVINGVAQAFQAAEQEAEGFVKSES